MNASTNIQRTPWRSSASLLLAALAAAVMVALGFLFLVPTQKAVAQVTQEPPPQFLLQWGSFGSGEGQFFAPLGVAVDSSGNVYVADFNHRIQKFNASGGFLLQWGSFGSGEGQFWQPSGVAVDSSGNVYVADTNNNRIQKFTAGGEFLTQWGSGGGAEGQFNGPRNLAVDSSSNVYVADNNNNRIQKFNASGEFLLQWGSFGSGEGQFDEPGGVAVDSSGNVYVADLRNHRIQKFNASGEFLTQWGTEGSGEGQFRFPQGVAVDSSDNVYVVDSVNHRIQKFNASGEFLTQWGTEGSGEGQFRFPQGVAVDSSGNIYVTDTNNHRIQKFGIATADTTPPVLELPEDITVNATTADGAQVTFEVSATDDTDPAPVVSCSAASGSLFPIGTTTVTCSATDKAGNTASGSFDVIVQGATEQVTDLKDDIASLNLPAGTKTSLSATLQQAQSSIEADNITAALEQLDGFIYQVEAQETRGKLSSQEADDLISSAEQIKVVLGG